MTRSAIAEDGRPGTHLKVKYYLSVVFLPLAAMQTFYPVLEKHRWLLPFCRIHRLFDRVFCKKGRVEEISQKAALLGHEQVQKQAEAFRAFGLAKDVHGTMAEFTERDPALCSK